MYLLGRIIKKELREIRRRDEDNIIMDEHFSSCEVTRGGKTFGVRPLSFVLQFTWTNSHSHHFYTRDITYTFVFNTIPGFLHFALLLFLFLILLGVEHA
jgi:hypothetical protein